MIVVCTNKNPELLERLLSSIRTYSLEDHRILLVETSDSTQSVFLAKKYHCMFEHSLDRLYEAGAYVNALKNHPNESEYFMFQDSLEIKKKGWEKLFRVPSQETKLVALEKIELWNDPGQHQYLLDQGKGCGYQFFESTFGKPWDHTAYGTMYNSFYLPHSAVHHFFDYGIEKLYVTCKNQSSESERFWGIIACQTCGFSSTEEYTQSLLGYEEYVFKHFHYRQ